MYVLPASQPPSDLQRKRRFRGQTLVEFALVLPVMLLVLFVIIEMARLLHAWLAVENGARFGIRYAVTGEYDQAFCVDGPDSGTEACDGPGRLSEQDAARLPSIEDATRAGAVAIMRNETVPVASPGYFKITLCSSKRTGAGPLFLYHDSNTPIHQPAWCEELPSPGISVSDAGGPGDRVSVTVDFEHPLIVPMLSSALPHIHLTSKREGIVVYRLRSLCRLSHRQTQRQPLRQQPPLRRLLLRLHRVRYLPLFKSSYPPMDRHITLKCPVKQ
jgi:hypothetical protein